MRLSILLATCALTLCAVGAGAEQIKLADGRYLQGEVVGGEVKPEGFTFRLTETGGKVFLRWGQVDPALKKRLMNERDPDEGLKLDVEVSGARLELIDGSVLEGQITQSGTGYRVVNRDYPRGRTIAAADVLEEGFVPDIMIDASVMYAEKEVLKLAEDERAPVEAAIQYYELARIADSLGLYEEAKDYVTLALAAGPDPRLEARLTAYDSTLAELIRQKGVLVALTNAQQLARKRKFQTALDDLIAAKDALQPTEAVLAKWTATYEDIDFAFTRFVIADWYKQIRPAARKKAKEDAPLADCIAWTRREMDSSISQVLADIVGSTDAKDIADRFGKRLALEEEGKIRLHVKKASFGSEGFYQIVGGNLQNGGKALEKPAAPAPAPGGRNDRRTPRPRNNSIGQIDLEEIERAIRGQKAEEGDAKQDVSRLKAPPAYPPLQDWWGAAGAATKARWIEAYYAAYGGTMRVVERNDWEVKYK